MQPMIPPKRFDIFPPRMGDAQKVQVRSDFSLKTLDSSRSLTIPQSGGKVLFKEKSERI